MIVNSKTPVTCQEWCTTFSVVYNKIHPAKNNVISWLKKDTWFYRSWLYCRCARARLCLALG